MEINPTKIIPHPNIVPGKIFQISAYEYYQQPFSQNTNNTLICIKIFSVDVVCMYHILL